MVAYVRHNPAIDAAQGGSSITDATLAAAVDQIPPLGGGRIIIDRPAATTTPWVIQDRYQVEIIGTGKKTTLTPSGAGMAGKPVILLLNSQEVTVEGLTINGIAGATSAPLAAIESRVDTSVAATYAGARNIYRDLILGGASNSLNYGILHSYILSDQNNDQSTSYNVHVNAIQAGFGFGHSQSVGHDHVGCTVNSGAAGVSLRAFALTALSSSVTLPLATIPVVSTAQFAATGSGFVGGQPISWTGKTASTLTGCTGGTGTIASGTPVWSKTANGTAGGQSTWRGGTMLGLDSCFDWTNIQQGASVDGLLAEGCKRLMVGSASVAIAASIIGVRRFDTSSLHADGKVITWQGPGLLSVERCAFTGPTAPRISLDSPSYAAKATFRDNIFRAATAALPTDTTGGPWTIVDSGNSYVDAGSTPLP